MLKWKKDLFVNVIKTRIEIEKKSKEDIIKEYAKLTDEEVKEILAEV